MRRFMILLAVLCMNPLLAGETEKGREAAEALCNDLLLPSDQDACLNAIKDVSYFQVEAVEICDDLLMASDKIQCLKAIRGRKYTDASLKRCEERLFPKDKNKCLEASGQKVKGSRREPDKDFIKSSLEKAIDLLKDGDTDKAIKLLETTLETL